MTHQSSAPSRTASALSPSSPTLSVPVVVADVLVVLIAAVTLVVLSVSFDARIAWAAQSLPPAVILWGVRLSALGQSNYMFATSGAIGCGALLARTLLRHRRFDAVLTVLGERALYVFATLSVGGIGAQLLKHVIGRARPRFIEAFGPYHFDMLSMKNSLASFPSGHTTTVFSMAVALGYLMPRLRLPLFVVATAIALSRVVVQAHYVSDIVAGGTLGIVSALLVASFFADRGMAFDKAGPHVRLKSPGLVRATLRRRAEP